VVFHVHPAERVVLPLTLNFESSYLSEGNLEFRCHVENLLEGYEDVVLY